MATNPTSNEKKVCGPCPHGMGPFVSDETCPWCRIERLTRERESLRKSAQTIPQKWIDENTRLREALGDAVGAIEESVKANQRGISTDWSGLLPSLKAALPGDSSAPETPAEGTVYTEDVECSNCHRITAVKSVSPFRVVSVECKHCGHQTLAKQVDMGSVVETPREPTASEAASLAVPTALLASVLAVGAEPIPKSLREEIAAWINRAALKASAPQPGDVIGTARMVYTGPLPPRKFDDDDNVVKPYPGHLADK